VVCTLPLPGFGSRQTAGDFAGRVRRHFCRAWHQSSPGFPGFSSGGRDESQLNLTVPPSDPGLPQVDPAETPERDSGLHATPVRFRSPTARRHIAAPDASALLLSLAPILTRPSWFHVERARTNRLLTSRSHSAVPGPSRRIPGRDTGA